MALLKKLMIARSVLSLVLAPTALAAADANDADFLSRPVSFGQSKHSARAVATPEATPVPTEAVAVAPKSHAKADSATAAALADLQSRLSALEAKPAMPALPFKLEGFADLRYDHQGDVALAYGAANSSAPKASLGSVLGNATTASRGALDAFYARRVELKLSAEPRPWLKTVFGWDVSENKLKDWGLSLEPTANLKLQLGQFRQRFGLETQVSSAKTWFIERALVYGGAHPFASGPSALAKERSAGVHAYAKQGWGPLSADLGISAVNDATEDQAVGLNKPNATGAFPATIGDHSPSLTLRSSIESDKLPGLKRVAFGASYLHDAQDSRPGPSDATQQALDEAYAYDGALEFGWGLRLNGEWMASQHFNGGGAAPNGVWLGVTRRKEGWYAALAQELLQPWMGATAPSVQFLLRRESFLPMNPGGTAPGSFGATTLALRWDPPKLWHSALNFTVYDVDGDAGALGGTELLSLQQQIAF